MFNDSFDLNIFDDDNRTLQELNDALKNAQQTLDQLESELNDKLEAQKKVIELQQYQEDYKQTENVSDKLSRRILLLGSGPLSNAISSQQKNSIKHFIQKVSYDKFLELINHKEISIRKIDYHYEDFKDPISYKLKHGNNTWWKGPVKECDSTTQFTNFWGFLFWKRPHFTKPSFDEELGPQDIENCIITSIEEQVYKEETKYMPE